MENIYSKSDITKALKMADEKKENERLDTLANTINNAKRDIDNINEEIEECHKQMDKSNRVKTKISKALENLMVTGNMQEYKNTYHTAWDA